MNLSPIYFLFLFFYHHQKKSTVEEHEFVQIPVKDLTYAQLQALKVFILCYYGFYFFLDL